MENKSKENRIMNFRKNGIHFYFGKIGVSMIWGWGSYSNNYYKVQHYADTTGEESIAEFGKCADIFDVQHVYCQNVELYPIGNWSKELKIKILKHFKTDEFPIGYVPVKEIPYVLNTIKKYSNFKNGKQNAR